MIILTGIAKRFEFIWAIARFNQSLLYLPIQKHVAKIDTRPVSENWENDTDDYGEYLLSFGLINFLRFLSKIAKN